MIYLFAASLLWAFSFGLIGRTLAGVDAPSTALVRLLLALLLFSPYLLSAWRRLGRYVVLQLFLVGAVQFGLMYVTYMGAYAYLAGHQVALMTTFTPLLVMLFWGLPRGRLLLLWLAACVCAVLGAAVTVESWSMAGGAGMGVVLIQLSNICFAAGQVSYRRVMGRVVGGRDCDAFSVMYLGAVAVALAWALPRGFPATLSGLSGEQWLALGYLGLVPAGAGFFLWNRGARKAAPGGLAVMNNLKVPLAVVCALTLFGERAPLGRVAASLVLLSTALILVSWPLRQREAAEA